MPPSTNANFPSLEDIMNQVRAICNDAFAGATNTPGEGQILTDTVTVGMTTYNNPLILQHLNSAIRELYRKLRITDGLLIQDNYILESLDVVDGPLGSAVPDPTIQCYLDTEGWWYGQAYDTSLKLPSDFYLPLKVWERASGTTDSFRLVNLVSDGLPPRPQVNSFIQWEYRNGALYFVGATSLRDIRLRYASLFPTFFTSDLDFSTSYIPVLDCNEFVAYKTSEKLSLALGNPTITQMLKMEGDSALFDLKNERVHRMQQANDLRRQGYEDYNTGEALDAYGI